MQSSIVAYWDYIKSYQNITYKIYKERRVGLVFSIFINYNKRKAGTAKASSTLELFVNSIH